MLAPLIRDLQILQTDGISIREPTTIILKGKLVSISADNLSAHALGGFQQNFTPPL